MSNIPENLKYTKDHEWIQILDDNTAIVGVTDYAQESLGDVTFVELPEIDTEFTCGESFGVIESVKAASDLYMPVAAKVTEINGALEDSPDAVNTSAYNEGWLVKIEISNPSELDELLDPEDYSKLI